MFYSQLILARKGPLAKIWQAAHFDKKLSKTQIFNTDISDSVESILNPATPLALRVSGHLMLGIVRIYSRKVKYLMTDCTEAMWKIKLSFRPNNGDIIDLQTSAIHNIDDLRYFGQIMPDSDFPELADTAFSQSMLTKYATLRVASNRTIAKQRDTIQDDDTGYRHETSARRRNVEAQSPFAKEDDLIDIPAEEGTRRSRRESAASRISDIGIARGEHQPRFSQVTARTSMSGVTIGFDDDNLPPIDDMFGGDMPPPIDMFDEPYLAPLEDLPEILPDSPIQMAVEQEPEINIGQLHITEEPVVAPVRRVPRESRAKRQRVIIDDTVELSSREIKERMADVSSILRRHPNDPLPVYTRGVDVLSAEQRLAQPSVRGLCPELMDLFAMTMRTGPLPFPQRAPAVVEDVAAPLSPAVSVVVSPVQQQHELSNLDIEIARDAGPTVVGRASMSVDGTSRAGLDISRQSIEAGSYFRGEQVADEPGFGDLGLDEGLPPLDFEHDLSLEMPLVDVSLGAFGLSHDLQQQHRMSRGLEAEPVAPLGAAGGAGTETWNPRTAAVLDVLKKQLDEKESVSFQDISSGVSKRLAAACFLEVLQLKTWGYIQAVQEQPFQDISILATDKTWTTYQ